MLQQMCSDGASFSDANTKVCASEFNSKANLLKNAENPRPGQARQDDNLDSEMGDCSKPIISDQAGFIPSDRSSNLEPTSTPDSAQISFCERSLSISSLSSLSLATSNSQPNNPEKTDNPIPHRQRNIEEAYYQPIIGLIGVPPCLIAQKFGSNVSSMSKQTEQKSRLPMLGVLPDRPKSRPAARWERHNVPTGTSSFTSEPAPPATPDDDSLLWGQLIDESDLTHSQQPIAPVTCDNLKELDLATIQNTITLRNDLPFDHDLSFQRISGPKGSAKKRKAEVFYGLLALEFQIINHNLLRPCSECGQAKPSRFQFWSRLGCYFSTLHDLLEMLVPATDKDEVRQGVDFEGRTRQVRMGMFDAPKFSIWLHGLITRHCAPMRDAMALEMQEKIELGAEQEDFSQLVDGMETLLNLLENMKIDIANHQIRNFKLLLIADTVPFLKDCFAKMQDSEQMTFRESKQWYDQITSQHLAPQFSAFQCFINSLVRLSCVDVQTPLPTTFTYDNDRFQLLRNDVLDYVHLSTCISVYVRTRKKYGLSTSLVQADSVRTRMSQLIANNEGASEGVWRHIERLTTVIANSPTDFDEITMTKQPGHLLRPSEGFDSSITRKHLENCLRQEESSTMDTVFDQLYPRTMSYSNRYLTMDTLQVSNEQRALTTAPVTNLTSVDDPHIEEFARRIAHIGVLHWQVWADLIYLDTP